MKLVTLRSDAPRNSFPVFNSNSGRAHARAHIVADYLSTKWEIALEYIPDRDGSRQGGFWVNATELTDLEVEGLHHMIAAELKIYPVVYDLANP